MTKQKLIIALLLIVSVTSEVQAGQYLPVGQNNNTVCDEISMSSQAPNNCLLSMVTYKGQTCYACRQGKKCNPSCSGGKMCINGSCVCPPKSGLIDCNGVCVSSVQCGGLAKTKRRTR